MEEPIDHPGRIEAVERELGLLLAAVGAGPSDQPVPSCPEWTVADLAEHVGRFCLYWTEILRTGVEPDGSPFDREGPTSDPVGGLPQLAGGLLGALHAADPHDEVWTWFPGDQTVRFVARRCTHELTIHRVDAQLARGDVDPIDAAVAVDGIEEVLAIVGLGWPAVDRGEGRTLHLHGTDHDDAEWLLTLAPGGVHVAREHAKGDLAVRASASDLELLLYQRPAQAAVERFGDDSVLGAFYEKFTF